MKKIIWIILLLIPVCHVKAEEWISSDQIPELPVTTLETKEEKEYQWYKIKKEGGYFQTQPDEGYQKTEHFSFTPWTDWGKEQRESDDVETRTVYYYKNLRKIKYIRIYDKKSQDMKISNIRIYKGRDQIEIFWHDENDETIIELMEPCFYDELEVEIHLINTVDNYNGFWMEWLYELGELPSMSVYTLSSFKTTHKLNFRYRNLTQNVLSYETEQKSFHYLDNNSHRVVRTEEEYRYRNRLYYYEKEEKEYYDGYSKTPIGEYIYPDFKTEKTQLYYRIKELEKPEVETKEVVKEVHDIVEVPVKEIVTIEKPVIKKESSIEFLNLKKDLEKANATIASFQNEKSRKQEVEAVNIKKQSFPFILFVPVLMIGFLVGRIVTTKKKL